MKISQLCMVELWFECFEYYPIPIHTDVAIHAYM